MKNTNGDMSRSDQGMAPIVIVDDERANLEALSLVVESLGCRPFPFEDAPSAIAAIRAGLKPSLVVSDYQMPGMNGLQFVEALRGAGNKSPVILLTAHGSIDMYFKALSLGVFDFVNKPVRDVELKRIIMTALEGHGIKSAQPH